MIITFLDRSNYFRGLLLLLRKDNVVAQSEIELMEYVGKTLGFDQGFCKSAIEEVLHNIHINDEPPAFSSKELAEKFLKDGLSIAKCDDHFHVLEEQWLRATAEKNGIDLQQVLGVHEFDNGQSGLSSKLEVNNLVVGDK